MAEHISFELVSPEKLLVSKPVTMVTIPGTEGDFGVLPGHAPVIATVRPGVLDVYEGDHVAMRLFVAGGFAEVSPERCTVLAEQAIPLAEISRPVVEKELKDLDEDLSDAKTDHEREQIEDKHAVALAMLEALTQHQAH